MRVRELLLKKIIGEKDKYIRESNHYWNFDLEVHYDADKNEAIQYSIYSPDPFGSLGGYYYKKFRTCEEMVNEINHEVLSLSETPKVSLKELYKIMDKMEIHYTK